NDIFIWREGWEYGERVDFTADYNACYKHLVSKLVFLTSAHNVIVRMYVSVDCNDTDKLIYECELKRNMGLFAMDAWLASGEADMPGLALCRAIEVIMKEEEKGEVDNGL
ncbi:unnamed protein product, partial [marine sediment metagenome]